MYSVVNHINQFNKYNVMKFEDLEVYKISMDLSDKIWSLVIKWDYFQKDTLAKQWVRAHYCPNNN